jgi:hypothetical protein
VRVSKKYITEVLDTAEDHLSKRFDDLLHIKNFKRPDFDSRKILYFQYNLGKLLHRLAKVRNQIAEEERNTIAKKQSLSPGWFRNRMKRLSEYKIVITRCIGIGKSLGDAFAWHFYKNNETQLFKHLEHEEIKIPPTGVGGLGELVFIRDRPVFSGYLCILHSNTSLLRYGDVSLIDMKTMKLFAIGELKTEKVSDTQLSLNLSIIGDESTEIFKEEFAKDPKVTGVPVTKKKFAADQFERQIKKIGEYFKEANKPKKGPDQFVFDNYHIREFECVVNNCAGKKLHTLKVADGLLYAASELKPRKLSKRFFAPERKPDFSKLETELFEIVGSLYSREIPNFDIQFGYIVYDKKLNYTAALGTAPLFWYPIKASVLKKIYLQEVFIFTLYNPAYLFHRLRALGLDFRKEKESKRVFYGMKVGGKNMGIERMSFFIGLIKNHLHTEQCIVQAISKIVEAMKEHADTTVPIRMEIATVQTFDHYNLDLEENDDGSAT